MTFFSIIVYCQIRTGTCFRPDLWSVVHTRVCKRDRSCDSIGKAAIEQALGRFIATIKQLPARVVVHKALIPAELSSGYLTQGISGRVFLIGLCNQTCFVWCTQLYEKVFQMVFYSVDTDMQRLGNFRII